MMALGSVPREIEEGWWSHGGGIGENRSEADIMANFWGVFFLCVGV